MNEGVTLTQEVFNANKAAVDKFAGEKTKHGAVVASSWNERTIGMPGTEVPLLDRKNTVITDGGFGSTPPLTPPDTGSYRVLEIPAKDVVGKDFKTQQTGPIVPSLVDVSFDVTIRDGGILDVQAILKNAKGVLVQAMREHRRTDSDESTYSWEAISNTPAQEIDNLGSGSGNAREVQLLLKTSGGVDKQDHYALVVVDCNNTLSRDPKVTVRMVPIQHPSWVEQTSAHMFEPVVNKTFDRSLHRN